MRGVEEQLDIYIRSFAPRAGESPEVGLVRLFRLHPLRAAELVQSVPRVVKRRLPRLQAERYAVALRDIGAEVELRASPIQPQRIIAVASAPAAKDEHDPSESGKTLTLPPPATEVTAEQPSEPPSREPLTAPPAPVASHDTAALGSGWAELDRRPVLASERPAVAEAPAVAPPVAPPVALAAAPELAAAPAFVAVLPSESIALSAGEAALSQEIAPLELDVARIAAQTSHVGSARGRVDHDDSGPARAAVQVAAVGHRGFAPRTQAHHAGPIGVPLRLTLQFLLAVGAYLAITNVRDCRGRDEVRQALAAWGDAAPSAASADSAADPSQPGRPAQGESDERAPASTGNADDKDALEFCASELHQFSSGDKDVVRGLIERLIAAGARVRVGGVLHSGLVMIASELRIALPLDLAKRRTVYELLRAFRTATWHMDPGESKQSDPFNGKREIVLELS